MRNLITAFSPATDSLETVKSGFPGHLRVSGIKILFFMIYLIPLNVRVFLSRCLYQLYQTFSIKRLTLAVH